MLGAASLLGLAVVLGLSLTSPLDVNQGSLVRLMFVHVPEAWLSYLAYGGTGLFGLLYLIQRRRHWDRLAMASGEIGLLFTLATIVGGMLWAKPTWGTYWVWDARLTTTALSLVVYGGYLLIRSLIDDPERRARVGGRGDRGDAVRARELHGGGVVARRAPDADAEAAGGVRWDAAPIYLPTLLLSVASFTLLYFFLLRLRGTLAAREEAREERELTGVTGRVEVARG